MTRSSLLSSGAAIALALLVSACGGATEEEAEAPPPAVEAAPVRAAGGRTGTLSVDGLQQLLLSKANSAVDPRRTERGYHR